MFGNNMEINSCMVKKNRKEIKPGKTPLLDTLAQVAAQLSEQEQRKKSKSTIRVSLGLVVASPDLILIQAGL